MCVCVYEVSSFYLLDSVTLCVTHSENTQGLLILVGMQSWAERSVDIDRGGNSPLQITFSLPPHPSFLSFLHTLQCLAIVLFSVGAFSFLVLGGLYLNGFRC